MDLRQALEQLTIFGMVNMSYQPHLLNHLKEKYSGFYEFHLADGKVDVLVIYMPHKTEPAIRLIRIGSHNDLFHETTK